MLDQFSFGFSSSWFLCCLGTNERDRLHLHGHRDEQFRDKR